MSVVDLGNTHEKGARERGPHEKETGEREDSARAAALPSLGSFQRIVIKIGSALLVDPVTGLRRSWLDALVSDIAALRAQGSQVLIVSSGAIALGRGIVAFSSQGGLKLEESQAAAAVGQIALARAYCEALGAHQLNAAQILLTLGDTEKRRRYLNARSTIHQLLALGVIPIVNENDTVATTEIRYGDNDRLAARVATMTSSDLLILLSDIDGLYTSPPHKNPDAQHIAHVPVISPEIDAMAGDAASNLSRGGMRTKLDAAKIATAGGTTMVIADGRQLRPISALASGARVTWFTTSETPLTARKRWIAGQLDVSGEITVDRGAAAALLKGKSLLPAGVIRASGQFERGDAVQIVAQDGQLLGRGLINFDCHETQLICGQKSERIGAILGYEGRTELVHRDNMVLVPGQSIGGRIGGKT